MSTHDVWFDSSSQAEFRALAIFEIVTPAQSDNENRFPIVKNIRDKITIKYLGHADRYQ